MALRDSNLLKQASECSDGQNQSAREGANHKCVVQNQKWEGAAGVVNAVSLKSPSGHRSML